MKMMTNLKFNTLLYIEADKNYAEKDRNTRLASRKRELKERRHLKDINLFIYDGVLKRHTEIPRIATEQKRAKVWKKANTSYRRNAAKKRLREEILMAEDLMNAAV